MDATRKQTYSTAASKAYFERYQTKRQNRAVDQLRNQGLNDGCAASTNGLRICLAAPPAVRDAIAKEGFLNQYQTGNSGGYFNPYIRSMREAEMFGDPDSNDGRAEYIEKVPAEDRPKYGFISSFSRALMAADPLVTGTYGSDIYIFGPTIDDQASFTAGDSLGLNFQPIHSVPLPWSQRDLMANFSTWSEGGVSTNSDSSTNTYVEAQIVGKASLEDVSMVFLSSHQIGIETLEVYAKHGICVSIRTSSLNGQNCSGRQILWVDLHKSICARKENPSIQLIVYVGQKPMALINSKLVSLTEPGLEGGASLPIAYPHPVAVCNVGLLGRYW